MTEATTSAAVEALRSHATDQVILRTLNGYHVEVVRMCWGNLRVVTTPVQSPLFYDRGWCYSRVTVAHVAVLASQFDPADPHDEPVGWVREVSTQRRACAHLYPPGEHWGYSPECPRCGQVAP